MTEFTQESRIRTRNTADTVGHHFNTERHSTENFRFTVIEKVRENNYFYRTARELFWMKKLKTMESLTRIILDEEVKDNGIANKKE